MRPVTCVFIVFVLAACQTDARRTTSFGSSRRGGSRTPSPPRRTSPPSHSSDNFLNAERGSTHNRGSQFTPSAPHMNNNFNPSAPQPPHISNPSGSQPSHTNGPIGFEGLSNANNKVNRPIGFDNVQNKPGPVGPPPAYPGFTGGSHDHPPAYPGRPINAPPSYQPNNPQPGAGNNYPNQYNPYPGQHSSYPGQQNPYPGQHNPYPAQQNPYPGQYNPYPNQHNSYPGQYNPYPGQNIGGGNQFGFGGSYAGTNGHHPGNSYPGSYSYPGTTYSGSPFGGGYNGNPHYSPNNFGYSGYPVQQNNYQQQSRFGGLPIPIPIPIPIGGGGLFGDHHSYSHHLLDKFIKSKSVNSTDNSTSVFLLNNSTVAPCTTDHFVYDRMQVTILSCTAEYCTAIKVSSHTNTTKVTVHSASITMCLEHNVTVSTHGISVVPIVSEIHAENTTLCRDIPNNITITGTNKTLNVSEDTTTDVPTTTPIVETTTSKSDNTTRLCETVNCWLVEMCLPTIEVVDQCNAVDCPFRRTGYTSCVQVKMCRSPTVPVSTSATLNNTISKIDEYNRFNSVHDITNLTLISYHRPVITFNCSQNVSGLGCPPPRLPASTAAPVTTSSVHCVNSTQPVAGDLFAALTSTSVCDSPTSTTTAVISESQTPAPQR